MRDDLTRIRNAWADRLAAEVCHGLGRKMRRSDMLAPWVADDQLTLAAVLSRIAVEDIMGSTPQTISDHLQFTGIVDSRVATSTVASDLVLPVLSTVRAHGVPWDQWWDVRGLNVLLVELWAGRRLSVHPRESVLRELVTLWKIPTQYLDIILENTADPFSSLPPDFLRQSATGAAVRLMHALAATGRVKGFFDEKYLHEWPEIVDRPDLAELVRRWHRRSELERAVYRRFRDIPSELEANFRSDLDAWDAQMRRLLSCLTAHELDLMKRPESGKRYVEKCLVAGRELHDARFMAVDALLWESRSSVSDMAVPDWMVDEIVTCGGRFFHTQVGPHPVWLATATTDVHVAAMRALTSGAQYGFGVEDSGGRVRLWLVLPVPPGDSVPASRVPYVYDLSWVDHAWQLLHLATVGYARLCVVRLVGDGELRAVGSTWLKLPEEVLPQLEEAAVMALRRLVGDETESILWVRATEGIDRAAEAAFDSCERAKGEDIHDELAPASDLDVSKRFIADARQLARARAWQAACLLDGRNTSEARVEVTFAVEKRQRTLELIRGIPDEGDGPERTRHGRDVFLPDEETIFVHLVNRFGRLQLAACWRDAERLHFALLPCGELSLPRFTELVRDWARSSPLASGTAWHQKLEQLLTACTEVAQTIAETAATHGLRRLVFSPTPPLELLPLHAAPLDREHAVTLTDVFDHVAYAPTARLVSTIERAQRHTAAVDVLMVAHSGAGAPCFKPIGGPRAEADMVAALHNDVEVITEKEATPARTLQAMADARIVHVACHGFTHPDRWATGLALQGGSLGEATLTTSRILADGTFSSVDLVILNACRTGAHESSALTVQTLRSIEAAFLARGARAIISTLWEITDLQGIVFSAVLHAHLSLGAAPGSAYRDTVRYLRWNEWRAVPRQERIAYAESLISAELPDWRDHLDQQVAGNSLFWTAFKITGAV